MSPRRLVLTLAAGGGLLAGTGCQQGRGERCPPPAPKADPAAQLACLPTFTPRPLVPLVEPAPGGPAPPAGDVAAGPVHRLTAGDTRLLAARNSGVARLLAGEPDDAGPRKVFHRPKGDGNARLAVRELTAEEARNRSAGDALDLYYKLAGTLAGADQALAAEAELAALVADAEKATAAGLRDRDQAGDLPTQLADVRAERVRLRGQAGELEVGLKVLLGLPVGPPARLSPDDPLEVPAAPFDIDAAVRVGLASRPDLTLLRTLAGSTDPDAPALTRKVLAGVNPLLGGGATLALPPSLKVVVRVVAPCSAPWPDPACPEAATAQVRTLLAERERQAEAEIRAAVVRTNAAAERARLGADLAGRLRVRTAELEKERAAGRAVTAELAKARGAARRADGEVLKAAVDYLSARAKLAQAQGVLGKCE